MGETNPPSASTDQEPYYSIGPPGTETSSLQIGGSLFQCQSVGSSSIGTPDICGSLHTQSAVSAANLSASCVSVIVTSRNYGRFLKECLQSILTQSYPAFEIIYCDDGSVDESIAVARQFPEVRLLCRQHEGIAAARNAAVAISTGEYLVHVDGDDILTPDFIENHLRALQTNPEASFAYGPADGFGIRDCRWEAPAWNRQLLWKRNYVNTSAMFRRRAFDAAGGWRAGFGTCFDWDLALRASRFGPALASNAVLRYRQHADSWSRRIWNDSLTREGATELRGQIRQSAATVTVACVFSNRVPELLPSWLEALADSITNSFLPRPNLFFIDGSPNQDAGERLLKEAVRFPMFQQIQYARSGCTRRPPFQREERSERAQFMASACNQILDSSTTDVIWFLEDDLIVPTNAYSDLMSLLLGGSEPRPAVAGLYRSRHSPDNFVAHHWNGHVETITVLPKRPTAVDMTGTGCLMVMRPFATHRFTSHVNKVAAHDWAWCLQLKREGKPVLVDPGVVCRHHSDLHHFV